MRRLPLPQLVAVFMASFMVLVLPACWYGAMTQAAILGTSGPSTSNSNEERDEHETHDETEAAPHRTRPPVPPSPSSHDIPVDRLRPSSSSSQVIATSVAPPRHPSQFSVRRLR